ncbi:MAG TPA: hypothetical protein VFW71_16745 [Actinomycetota bacterium]|nr:hypothetical protein [Actinomycetota bacterium]
MSTSHRAAAGLGPLGGYWRPATVAILVAGAFAFHGAVTGSSLGAIRGTFTLLLMGFGPGLAIMGVLRVDDMVLELSLALALSLAIDTLLAMGMILLHHWSPTNGLFLVMAVSALGCLVQASQVRRLKARPRYQTGEQA